MGRNCILLTIVFLVQCLAHVYIYEWKFIDLFVGKVCNDKLLHLVNGFQVPQE